MMQKPTEWMAENIANALQRAIRGESLMMISIDRYHYIGTICPSMRTRLMDDNNTWLVSEL